MIKDTVTVQEAKIEVKLYVGTEPEDFKNWLREHLPSGWDIDPYGPRFPTGDGGHCILEPAKVERTNERNYNVKVPGTCWTESTWTEQGSVHRSESYASVVTEMIWFKITRLAPGRVEVVARCEHFAARDYFRKKLEEIAEAYPEARQQVAKQLGIEKIPVTTQPTATQPTAFTRPALPPSQATSSSSNMPNTQSGSILIVTIAKVEAQSILETFSQAAGKEWTRQVIGDKIYYDLGVHGGASVFMVQSEMGTATPAGALLTVSQAIQDLRPQAVIMCGIAFGLRPNKQKLGDILVARQLGCYEPQKVDLQKGQMLRGDRTTASERLLRRFRSGEIDWEGASIHFGLVLSGEKLVNDPAFRDRLLNTEPEAIGGEMEGTGLYAAARGAKVDWILVKAICDWADGTKNDDAQPLAARNAAQFALHVLQLGGWGGTEQSQIPMIAQEAAALSADLQAINAERCQNLLEQLATQQRNLNRLELQSARCGMDVPLKLSNQIEVMKQCIEEIKQELAQLGCD